ncbi:MAG: TonB-dependent receptor plug domain-containing protein [Alphaproteobacteria bacterium]|nr:TonB-dependent receptor plug domain-containing protein [Alphaproteobacteria bacterium]
MKKWSSGGVLRRLAGKGLAGTAGALVVTALSLPASAADNDGQQKPEAKGGPETVYVSAARKQEERAIDTPVALSAMNEEQIARYNTTNMVQLQSQLPGVRIYAAGGGGQGGNLSIRGIGQLAIDYGAEQPVAFVMDGFSFTRGHIVDVGLFDLSDVEVLKGPQTQYFGKNSPAGVIAVTSKSPGDTFEGFARLSYEFRSQDPSLEFGVSVPVNDKFKFRFAGRGEFMQGGYIRNTGAAVIPNPPELASQGGPSPGPSYGKYPKQKQYIGRLTMVFTPTDNFDATLKIFGSYTHQDDIPPVTLYKCADGPGAHPYLNYLFGLLPDTNAVCPGKKLTFTNNSVMPPVAVQEADRKFNGDAPDGYFNWNSNILTTLQMNWKIGDITITSVTGFWKANQKEYTNYDYSSFATVQSLQGERGHSFTQELRVKSNYDSPVNFMIGGFYEKTRRQLDAPVEIFPLGPAPSSIPATSVFGTPLVVGTTPYLVPIPSDYVGTYLTYHQHWDNHIESWSVFGDLTWDILDNLSFDAGIRYTEDNRHSTGDQLFNRMDYVFGPGAVFAPTGTIVHPTTSFHNTSPSATLSWHPSQDTMIYAAYKTGFQSAGVSNPGTFGAFVNSDNAKDQAFVNSILTFKGSTVKGFETGIKGIFFDKLTADATLFTYKYSNLQVVAYDSSTVSFITQNAAGARAKGFEVNMTLQATDALQLRTAIEYSHLQFTTFATASCYPGEPGPSEGVACGTQDLTGQRYGGPPWTISGGFTYEVPLNDTWNFGISGDAIWFNDGFNTNGQPDTFVPSYWLLNLSARVYQAGGPWEFSVACTNCANEFYLNNVGNKNLAKNGDLVGYLGRPRLITLQATYRW